MLFRHRWLRTWKDLFSRVSSNENKARSEQAENTVAATRMAGKKHGFYCQGARNVPIEYHLDLMRE